MDLLNFDPRNLGGRLDRWFCHWPCRHFSYCSGGHAAAWQGDLGGYCFICQLDRFGSLVDFGAKVRTLAAIGETEHG